jgi:DNA-binding IclR family transcriptional regulator
MKANIVDTPEMQEKCLDLLVGSPTPVTVGFVAYHLGVNYGTAKLILLTLLAQGKIEGQRTNRSWFFLKKECNVAPEKKKS